MDILYVHFTDVPKNANPIKSHDFSDQFASRTNTSTFEKTRMKNHSWLQRLLSQLRIDWQLLAYLLIVLRKSALLIGTFFFWP